jgi:hypothetical protein
VLFHFWYQMMPHILLERLLLLLEAWLLDSRLVNGILQRCVLSDEHLRGGASSWFVICSRMYYKLQLLLRYCIQASYCVFNE